MCIRDRDEDDRPKVAVVGKPNVGKSSIVNKLSGNNRVIVSDIAGTTRDAIDTDIRWNGKEYIFIDTAGSVSYTHLDVYKRQAPPSSMPNISGLV